MNISIPEKFEHFVRNFCVSKVADGELFIYDRLRFESIIYDITYIQKDSEFCHFCGRPLTDKNRTVDHLYPRTYGGISIPENLEPSCKKCNNEKSDMNEAQYIKYKAYNEKNKKFYKNQFRIDNEMIIQKKGFILPNKWIDTVTIDQIMITSNKNTEGYRINEFNDDNYSKKYSYIIEFIKKYNLIPRPVVLDRNQVVIYGNSICLAAYEKGFFNIPAVVLENVSLEK